MLFKIFTEEQPKSFNFVLFVDYLQIKVLNKELKSIFLILLLILTSSLLAQTGIAGVGTTDGTSNLEFWYMADGEGYANGALVNSITDRSGNGRTLSAAGGERPSYTLTTAAANNMSSLNFNLNDELETTYQGNSNENMSFGMMLSYTNSGNLNIGIQHGGRNTMGFTSSHRYTDFVGAANQISGTAATAAWTYHSKTFANSGANRLRYYVNLNNTDVFTHNIENRTSNTWIGGHGTGGGTGFLGGIAEVYKFSRVLNSAEQIIIANYFAAKYNVTLATTDIYDGDDGANGDYDHEVAGIGRVNASNLHNDAQGTSIVRIRNPSNLGNNEFLIWGHDNGTLVTTNLVDIPAPVEARFTRVWRVSETNASSTSVDVGSIDIRWDLTNFVIGSTAASDLRLLVDTDNDGVFSDETPIAGATALGGNIYQFAGVTAIADSLRFTLGTINRSLTPLPIELINFTATPINNNQVKLAWKTATEINNDNFTIERSVNGRNWEFLKTIDGAGNSSTLLNYKTSDNEPYTGISYYRLKQTDFDGQYSYSVIRSVQIKEISNSTVEIYPNPANNLITLTGNKSNLKSIAIYNVIGQNVTNRIIQKNINTSKMEIDISALSSGTYYIKSTTLAFKFYKQ